MDNELIGRTTGLKYIPIMNIYNSYCYYISSVQKIMSSKTFRNNISKISSLEAPWNEIMSIFDIYSKNGSFKDYETVLNKYFAPHMNNGGIPNIVMSQIFLPLLYHFFTDDFKSMFEEISFKYVYIAKAPKSSFNFFNDDKLNNELYSYFTSMYEYLTSNINDIHYKHPEMLLASIYLENKCGHAINVLDSKDGVYVFDDDVIVKPLKVYLEELGEKFVRVVISDFDIEFNKLLPRTGFKHEARIHKITITNWKHEDDAKYLIELQRGNMLDSQIASYDFNSINNGLTGGTILDTVALGIFAESLPKHLQILLWIVNGLLITLILIIIVMKIIGSKNNKEIQKVQNKLQRITVKSTKAANTSFKNVTKTLTTEIENDVEKNIENEVANMITPNKVGKSLLRATKLFSMI
jgi:hypothetical protein